MCHCSVCGPGALAIGAAVALSIGQTATAQVTATFSQPDFDRWNYPFNSTPGTRTSISTFGALGVVGSFDDRDAQNLNSYITSGQYAPGLGASNYIVTGATLTAKLIGGTFSYDTVRNNGSSIELFGTGFRNGFNALSYGDSGPFAFGPPTGEDIRNAHATDNAGGSRRDVSNEDRDGFVSSAFAIGQIVGEVPGTVTGSGQDVVFQLDLGNPDVVRYLQDSLDAGIVSLTISSLHPASQGGPTIFPVFGSVEGGAPASLTMTVQVIPAPTTMALLACAGVAGWRRRR